MRKYASPKLREYFIHGVRKYVSPKLREYFIHGVRKYNVSPKLTDNFIHRVRKYVSPKLTDYFIHEVRKYASLIFLLFPHFTSDCENIVLLTSEFNCSRHLIGQFLFCRDYFLSNCDRSFYQILKDIVGLNTIYM